MEALPLTKHMGIVWCNLQIAVDDGDGFLVVPPTEVYWTLGSICTLQNMDRENRKTPT